MDDCDASEYRSSFGGDDVATGTDLTSPLRDEPGTCRECNGTPGVVRGVVADEEALVEWFQEHRTCIHDSHIEHLGACVFCLARWLIRSDWLATYTAQQLHASPAGWVGDSGTDDEFNL